jgi:hypothetical protein
MLAVSAAVLISTAGEVTAQVTDYATSTIGSWTNAANWSLGTVPVSTNTVRFKQGSDVTLDVTGECTAFRLGILNTIANESILRVVSNGVLNVGTLDVGYASDDAGKLEVNGGSVVFSSALNIGGGSDTAVGAVGTAVVTNGTLSTIDKDKKIYIGRGPGSKGTATVQDDGLLAGGYVYIGSSTATGTVYLTGGMLEVLNPFANKLVVDSNNGNLHITDGVLKWNHTGNNKHDDIWSIVEAGGITWAGTTTNMLYETTAWSTNNGSSTLYAANVVDGSAKATYVWAVASEAPPKVPDTYGLLIDYQFNEAVETQLTELQNDGPLSAVWDADATNGVYATGTGFLTAVTNMIAPETNNIVRRATLDTPLTNGWARFQWRLDSWDYNNLSADGGIGFGLVGVDGAVTNNVLSKFVLRTSLTESRIQIRAADGSPKSQMGFPVSGTGPIDYRLTLNLDESDLSVEWSTNATDWVDITPAGAAGLDRIDQVSVRVFGDDWTNSVGAFANVDFMTLSEGKFIVSAEEMYNEWLADYPTLGSLTNQTDNKDGDALNNLYEYGLGGDPDNASDEGIPSVIQTVEDGGANYLQYIHVQRDDAVERGLSYHLETDDDLVTAPGWTNAHYEVVGTNASYGVSGFDTVTNRVSTDVEDAQFIKLIIEAN